MDYNISYRDKDKGIQVIISYKDRNGKWRQKSKQGFKGKKEAKRYADTLLEELKESIEMDLSDEYKGITFKDYTDLYLKTLKLQMEPQTVKLYKSSFKNFIKLDDMAIEDINFLHVQDCVNDMIKGGLHSNTIKEYVKRIKIIFRDAVKPYRIIPVNPIDDEFKIPSSKIENKIKALNKHELDNLLSNIEPQQDYITTLLGATCGLRVGEVLGLQWNDIDLKGATLNINKQWKRLKNGTIGFGELKTKNSNRVVPIPPKTLSALKAYKNTSPTDLNNRVVLDSLTNTTSVRLKSKFKKIGYDITIHDLRHTYATFLISSGLDFKTVAMLLGHTVEMTMKTYSHVNQDMIDMATSKINMIF